VYTGSTIVGRFLRSTSSPSETRKSFELIFIFILSEAQPAHRDLPSSEPELNRHTPDSGTDEGIVSLVGCQRDKRRP
jgi:hypothetical protein